MECRFEVLRSQIPNQKGCVGHLPPPQTIGRGRKGGFLQVEGFPMVEEEGLERWNL